MGSDKEESTQGLVNEPIVWDKSVGRVEMQAKDDGAVPRLSRTEIRDFGRCLTAACELPEGK